MGPIEKPEIVSRVFVLNIESDKIKIGHGGYFIN